jgi:hypothetical protein
MHFVVESRLLRVSLLWSHFVHWHNAVEGEVHTKVIVSNDRLLEEVHRMANLWRTYWAIYSKGGRKCNVTMMKLNQIAGEHFSWATVLSWDL